MKTKLLALFAALGTSVAFAGNTGTIEGSVVAHGGKSIAGTRIEINCGGVKRTAAVDAAGNFFVGGLLEGTCTLTAKRKGFADTVLVVTVSGGSIATVLVGMSEPVEPTTDTVAADEGRRPAEPSPPMVAAPNRRMPRPDPAMKPDAPKHERANKDMKPGAGGAARPQAAPVMPKQVVKLENAKRLDDAKMPARGRRLEIAGEKLDQEQQNMGGFAPVRVFPVPQYKTGYDGPRTDFRETIYWNPSVQTDDTGNAEITFPVSDAVTAFRATAEGFSKTGTPGGGQLAIQSKLPLTLDAKLPVEVTAGDVIRLPVTLANETDAPIDATLDAKFGNAFKLVTSPSTTLRLAPGEKKAVFFPLEVIATSGTADVELAARSQGLADELKKKIRVVPRGFPFEVSASGTARKGTTTRHAFDLTSALQGSIEARVTMYPSPVASMTSGMEGMIREPGGCFEQTSSTNYPNIMILSYLQTHDAADASLVDKTHGTLERGYKLLTGYETQQRGYEWFGKAPGHEALTAYGLMEFADMAQVYEVDPKMVERTADWLMSRRNGKGGFSRSSTALDTFGRANEDTTTAYIMWALAEAKRTKQMDTEMAVQKKLAGTTKDPYLLALSTNTMLLASPTDGAQFAKRLVAMQSKDGSFPGAAQSITMSGGDSLTIETTALATLALLKVPNEYTTQVRSAVEWLNGKRGGYGQWGNTQATILGLKALSAYAESMRQMQTAGSATLIVNGKRGKTIEFEAGRKEALVWDDFANALSNGTNVVEVELTADATLPYSVAIGYRSAQPQSSPNAKVSVATSLAKTQAKMGEGVSLKVQVANTTAQGIPMTLARVGIPGGMVFQTWQLKELREKGIIDFYETRPREVILYWRQLAPSVKHDVDIQLLAAVPGNYEAPASSAYLYYTAEDKAWTQPVKLSIDK